MSAQLILPIPDCFNFAPALDVYMESSSGDADYEALQTRAVEAVRECLDEAIEMIAPNGQLDETKREMMQSALRIKAVSLSLASGSLDELKSLVASVPDQVILDEYVTGIPRILQSALFPVSVGDDLPDSEFVDWDLLGALVRHHQEGGRCAGIFLDVNGGFGIELSPEDLPLERPADDEVVVHYYRRSVEAYMVRKWSDLRDGRTQ
jgi:hypothetical protein